MQASTDKLVRGSVTVKDAEGNLVRYSTSTANAAAATEKAGMSFQQAAMKAAAFAATLGVVNKVQQFAGESYAAARAQNDMRNALLTVVGSMSEYNNLIDAGRVATKGMMTETELAQAGMVLLKSGIAGTSQEVGRLAGAGTALVNTYAPLGASQEKLTRFILSGNKALLDNFNFTTQQVAAMQAHIEATTNLSGAEAAMAARKALVIQEGEKLLGTVSAETIQVQQLTAAWSDFEAAFGQVMISLNQATGIVPGVTGVVQQLTDGAKAWQYVLTEAIPAIDQHNAGLARQAAQNAINAKSQEELDAAWQQGRSDFDAFTSALAQGAGSVEEYNRIVTEGSQGNYFLAQSLQMTEEQFNAAKTAMVEAAQVAAVNVYQGMRQATAATYEAAQAARELAAAQAEQVRIQQGISAFGVDTNRERAAYAQLFQARAGQQEALLQFNNKTEQERINERKKAEDQAAREMEQLQHRGAKAMTKSFDQAAQQIRSTIESVLSPSLDEVWKPPEGAEVRIDEAARRLATVTTAGFGSEWLNQLNTQFAGQDFWKPMADAMASGDAGALKAAANNILTNSVTSLWDVEAIKQKVREQLQQQNLRQQIIDQVQAELAAEGTVMSPEQITQIATGAAGVEQGATGAGQAVAGIATDATTAQTALDTLGLSLDNVSVTNIPAMITASDELVVAIQGISGGITAASPQIVAALSGTVEELQTVVRMVKWSDLGKAIDQGIAKGISDNEELVVEKLKSLMWSAMEAAGNAIGYGSPAAKYIPLGASISQGLAVGVGSYSGEFQDSLNKLLGINPNALEMTKLADAAVGGMKSAFSRYLADSKAHWGQRFILTVFKNNADAILNATDRTAAFNKAIKATGANLERVGFSGTHAGTIQRAAAAFLKSFDKVQAAAQKQYQEQLLEGAGAALDMGTSIVNLAEQGAGVLNNEVDRLAYLLNTSTGPIEWNGQILDAASATDLLNQKMQEQANIQDDLLRLQEGQSRLSFLKQQLDLVNQLSQVGLNPGDILGDAFGPNASLESIIEASTRAVQALIQHTEGSLAGLQPMSGTQNVSNRSSNLTINGLTVSNGMDVNSLIALIQRTAAGVA